jgi:hypothetical protein
MMLQISMRIQIPLAEVDTRARGIAVILSPHRADLTDLACCTVSGAAFHIVASALEGQILVEVALIVLECDRDVMPEGWSEFVIRAWLRRYK